MSKKETINLTPTWSQALPLLINALQCADAAGVKIATEELKNMARVADLHVQQEEAQKNALIEFQTENYNQGLISEEEYNEAIKNVGL